MVGGAVRDAALGREVVDVDVAVAGDEREAARAIAARGRRATRSSSRPSSRPGGRCRADEGWHVDVGAPARRRRSRPTWPRATSPSTRSPLPLAAAGAEPIDPTGGLGRPRGRRAARGLASAAFADDPLRLLRAARLAAELGFELEDGTVALARDTASRAGEPAGERQLRRAAPARSPRPTLSQASSCSTSSARRRGVLPEVEALRGVEQNPNHHLDVHGHTLEVLRRLLELEADLAQVAGDRAGELRDLLAEPLADSFTRGEALRFGALAARHRQAGDARRAAAATSPSSATTTSGRRMVDGICERLQGLARARDVSARGHAAPPAPGLPGRRAARCAPRRIHDYLRATEPVSADVTLLTVADRLSARGQGPIASPEMIQRAPRACPRRCSPPRSTAAATARRARRSPATSSPSGSASIRARAGPAARARSRPASSRARSWRRDDAVELARAALKPDG